MDSECTKKNPVAVLPTSIPSPIVICTGIKAGAVAHAELFCIRDSGCNKGNFLAYALNDFSAFFYLVYVGRIQDDTINTFFKNLDHKPGLFAIVNLDHNVRLAACEEVFNRDNRPVEHFQHENFANRHGRGFVLITLAGYVNELGIDARANITALFDGLDFSELPHLITIAIGQNNRFGPALKRSYRNFLTVRHNIYPQFFHWTCSLLNADKIYLVP